MEDNMQEKLQEIIEFMSDYLGIIEDEIDKDTKLMEDIGLDSLAFMELIGEVEDEFGIQIEESEISSIVTVADLAKKVCE